VTKEIYVWPAADLNLRVPSRNEAGTNSIRIPGSKLLNGNLKAVIDLKGIPATHYKVNDLKF
jgi:hypothetical protein